MRKLQRNAVPAPACLANFQHGTHTWCDVGPAEKEEIRNSLEQLQGRRCAYCEGSLDVLGQHIEHFRRKGIPASQHLTFVWANLFWSCYQDDSCGRHKDSNPITNSYDPNDLIDPCVSDPDVYFRFLSNGTIRIRAGLTVQQQKRAEETLRVFNLNPAYGRLRSMRERALEAYTSVERGILEALRDINEADRKEFIREEIEKTANDPFCTVIRHFFEEVV